MLRIILWNVNGIRAVDKKGALKNLLDQYDPDILLLNEIKGTIDKFPEHLVSPKHYQAFYHSAEKPGYAGSGIWVKRVEYLEVERFYTGLDGRDDHEGRTSNVLLTAYDKPLHVISCYFPNGGKSEEAFADKLIFYEDFLKTINRIRSEKKYECLWGGDVNCAHNEVDLARPKENEGQVGFHPDERAWLDKVVKDNWVDIYRDKYPDAKDVYSWWSLQTRARERNIGWRIDYFFIDAIKKDRVKKIEYLKDHEGSDHCPLLLELSKL